MPDDVGALSGMEVNGLYECCDYTYGEDCTDYSYAAGVHADHYSENGIPYDEVPTTGKNWWNVVSWFPKEPDEDDLNTGYGGVVPLESHYRVEGLPTTDENGVTIDSPLDITDPAPTESQGYRETNFGVSFGFGPLSLGLSSLTSQDPSVTLDHAPDHHYAEWTIGHSASELPSGQDDSHGVNFAVYCGLNDSNQDYEPTIGDKEVTVKCESQDTFGYYSTRAGGGTVVSDTPNVVMYPSVNVV